MIIILFIPVVIATFNANYVTDSLKSEHIQLSKNKTYLVQMIVTQFPLGNFCLPFLQVTSNNYTYTDSLGYSTRSHIQKVYVNDTEDITLEVSCVVLDVFKNLSQINKTIHFNMTINEAIIQVTPPCYFPKFGINCNLQMQQIQTDFEITIDILNNSWFYAYTILGNSDYQLIIENEDQLFGISSIPADKVNSTILPSFTLQFQILEPDNSVKSISLRRSDTISDFIFIIGLFNFNMDEIKSITITFMSSDEDESFPIWAILLLISIILLGVMLSLGILYHYRRQYKRLTQSKPALDRKTLKKYMPILRIDAKMIHEICSVCLVQFELKDKYCQTPCKHYFHEQCLSDWYCCIRFRTIKQANCPVCRFGLSEDDMAKQFNENQNKVKSPALSAIRQDVTSLKEDQVQSKTDRGLPFIQLGSTPCIRTQCRLELDNSPDSGNSPKLQFDNSPQNLTSRKLRFHSDEIVESQN